MYEKAPCRGNLGCEDGVSQVTNRRPPNAHATDGNLRGGKPGKSRIIRQLAGISQITTRVLRGASGNIDDQEYINSGGSPGVPRHFTADEDEILLLGNPAAILRRKDLHAGFGGKRRVEDRPCEENKARNKEPV